MPGKNNMNLAKMPKNGQSEPTLTNLVKSADLFDVSAYYLLGRTDLYEFFDEAFYFGYALHDLVCRERVRKSYRIIVAESRAWDNRYAEIE